MGKKIDSEIIAMQGNGFLLPQAVDVERGVLGGILLEANAIYEVIGILRPESFYKEENVRIYDVVLALQKKSVKIDLLTVSEELKKRGELDLIGGPSYISSLTTNVGSTSHIVDHALIVQQKYMARELIKSCSEMVKKAYNSSEDVFDLLEEAEKTIFNIGFSMQGTPEHTMAENIHRAFKQMEANSKKEGGLIGVPTGLIDLDRLTGGLQSPDLIILAARPGMGKTALAINVARNAAIDFNVSVGIFSLEMSTIQLVNRLIAGEANLSSTKVSRGDLDTSEWAILNSSVGPLSASKMYINDKAAISVQEVRSVARRWKMKHDIKLLIVDYLQLMTYQGGDRYRYRNREQEISKISAELKALAKDLNIPIIALSQLSRGVETRGGDKKPQLSDLRESGSIEQDADIVCFLFRPGYYKFDEYTITDDYGNTKEIVSGKRLHNLAFLLVKKHRNGGLADIPLKWEGQYTKFSTWEPPENIVNPDQFISPGFTGDQDDEPFK